ncbi:hypothetical protein BJ741DRAFT_588924 [Chytriomyces cf. hyalinus JEL632]|nr:hypothetical protein BJ741DRAFT_588924 [Chytriomyces cf. hyalinus JEL632]
MLSPIPSFPSPVLSFHPSTAKKPSVMNISHLIDSDSNTSDIHSSDAWHFELPHRTPPTSSYSPLYHHRDSLTPPTTPATSYNCTPSPTSEHATGIQLPSFASITHSVRKAPYPVPLLYRKSESVSVDDRLLPFQCPHCPKAYKTKHYLESHSATHMIARPFVCHLSDGACHSTFRRLSDLRRHMKSVKH